MHGQQLDRRHAEVLEVVGDGRRRQSGVRPAELLGHPVVQRGHALDVHLVDHGVAPAAVRRGVRAPLEVVVDDHAAGDVRRRVEVAAGLGVVLHVAEDGLVDDEVARHGPAVGVEQQLGGVEPQSGLGVPRPVGAIAVARAARHARQRSVPHAQRELGQPVARLDAVLVEQAHPHRSCLGGVHREVGRLPATTSPPGGGCDPARPPWSRRRGSRQCSSRGAVSREPLWWHSPGTAQCATHRAIHDRRPPTPSHVTRSQPWSSSRST